MIIKFFLLKLSNYDGMAFVHVLVLFHHLKHRCIQFHFIIL